MHQIHRIVAVAAVELVVVVVEAVDWQIDQNHHLTLELQVDFQTH